MTVLGRNVDDRTLLKMGHAAARRSGSDKRAFAKRRLLPFYQQVKSDDRARWESWGVTPELEKQLLSVLRMKPRRSASGVATITVITKPWPFYQQVKSDDRARWESWGVTPELEKQLLSVLRMKPRRSASGVATITVITKPWPCGGDCLFCPCA